MAQIQVHGIQNALQAAARLLLIVVTLGMPLAWVADAETPVQPSHAPSMPRPVQTQATTLASTLSGNAIPPVSNLMLSTTDNLSALPPDYFDLQKPKIMRWNDQAKYLLVYISDGSYLPGWNPNNPNLVKAAFQEWEQAMAPRFHFIYMPDERGADVKVIWVTRLTPEASGEAAGVNELQTWGKFIAKNDIKLALISPEGRAYTPSATQSIALHEIGHMLGLRAHSTQRSDVMYPSMTPESWETPQHLSTRDINTLHRVYEAKADYKSPPGYHLSNFDQFKRTQHGRRMTFMWISMPGVPFPVPIILPF